MSRKDFISITKRGKNLGKSGKLKELRRPRKKKKAQKGYLGKTDHSRGKPPKKKNTSTSVGDGGKQKNTKTNIRTEGAATPPHGWKKKRLKGIRRSTKCMGGTMEGQAGTKNMGRGSHGAKKS